jgi:hypothetical protein
MVLKKSEIEPFKGFCLTLHIANHLFHYRLVSECSLTVRLMIFSNDIDTKN